MKKGKFTRLALPAILFLCCWASGSPAQTKTPPKPAAKPLPNLVLNTIEGKRWSLQENRGRIVLLNFWATWCAPCREEVPLLIRLSDKYKASGLEIIGVTVDSENVELIKRFIAEFKVDYPVLLTVPGSLLSQQESLPMTLIIDEKGFLAKKYVGLAPQEVLEKDIKDLLSRKSGGKNGKTVRR
jgi:thiol-disulfide isomerase/thioredoxin